MRLILFDIDGTLIKTQGLGRRALDLTFQELYGWEEATRTTSFLGATDPKILRDVFAAQGLSAGEASREQRGLLSRYLEILAQQAASPEASCEVLPGVLPLLEHLASRDDCTLGLLTGNVRGGAQIKLELCQLWEFFPLGAFGDDADHRVGLLPVALERANTALGYSFRPEDTVVIGDTPADIEVGRAHRARAVAVATGWISQEELATHQPDVLLEDMSRLEEVVELLLT